MSGDNLDNEQITKDPESDKNITNEKVNKLKTKDPKKVAAGKKLAELNKKAKDALAREMKGEADPEEKWLPELSFTTLLAVVGYWPHRCRSILSILQIEKRKRQL